MDSKLNLFLKKINLNDEYFDFFKSSTLDKIVINKNNKSFLVKITIDKYLPKDILSNLVENKSLFADDLTYNFTVRNPDNNILIDYYPYFLDILKEKDKIKLTDVYKDSLIYEDDTLRLIAYNKKEEEIPSDILALVAERAAARKAKDFARADALRDEIVSKGYLVEETRQGTKVSKKN